MWRPLRNNNNGNISFFFLTGLQTQSAKDIDIYSVILLFASHRVGHLVCFSNSYFMRNKQLKGRILADFFVPRPDDGQIWSETQVHPSQRCLVQIVLKFVFLQKWQTIHHNFISFLVSFIRARMFVTWYTCESVLFWQHNRNDDVPHGETLPLYLPLCYYSCLCNYGLIWTLHCNFLLLLYVI